MAGYDDTRKKIIKSLLQRPNGMQIQPENHQDFALSLLDYIRDVELISSSTLIGIAYTDTIPVQSNVSNVSYIAGISQQQTVIFENFSDINGNPIEVSTGEGEAKLVILIWNKQYWEKQEIVTNIISQSNNYVLTIRKTYSSKSEMEEDKLFPIGNDGNRIKQGEFVSVYNEFNETENAIYSYEHDFNDAPYWELQYNLFKGRTIDGGRADSKYGGSLSIDCGTA